MGAGETLDLGALGVQVQVRASDESQLQYDVIGSPRGLIVQEHVHSYQTERFEVLSGAMKLVLAGSEHELRTGQVMEVTELDRPRIVSGEVQGDLRGRGTWTLTPSPEGTHVRFDWRVYADRPLLRALTPLLRPLLRYNHNWAIARARPRTIRAFASTARRLTRHRPSSRSAI
ncbi:MAG: SRPBCC family protein [Solirubrobacteraceae bacterium]